MKRYLTILSIDTKAEHNWNGNEKSGNGTHNGAIRLSPDPTTIKLTWASDSASAAQYVGTYQLFLQHLLNDGYIARDRKPGHVRVKFVNISGVIKLAKGIRASKRLVVGEFRQE